MQPKHSHTIPSRLRVRGHRTGRHAGGGMLRRPLVAVLAAVSMAVGLPTLGVGVEVAGADPVTPKAVLVTEGATAGSLEMPLFNRLKGLGFPEVETVADEAMNAAKTRGANLVVVSPTVASADFTGDELVKVSVPIISMKAYEQDGLQMAGSNAGVDHGTFTTDQVQVTDPDHPLAAGLSGTLPSKITETALPIGWVKLPSDIVDAQTVAKNAEGNPVLFAWKQGDAMFPEIPPNGTVELLNAPGCRVGFPGQRNSPKEFTPAGWKLFDAAVSWSRSSACGPTRPYPVNPPVKTCMPNEAPPDVPGTADSSGYAWPQWVDDVLYHQGVYYLGGRFTEVSNWDGSGTVARAGLAACDASTGAVLPWNPNLPIAADPPITADPQMVRALAADGGWLYVGGKFDVTSPTGILKKNFVRVRLADPALNWQADVDWAWGPDLRGGVQAILIDPGAAIYIGGGLRRVFEGLNEVVVSRLVKLNLDGTRDPNFAPVFETVAPLRPGCTPTPEDDCTTDPYGDVYTSFESVHSLALDGNDLYVGGAFTKVNGVNRAGVAALPKSTGAGAGTFVADLRDANTYDPLVQVHDIFVYAGYVYLCGDWWITENQGQLSDPGKDALKDQQYNSGKFYKSGASVRVPVPDGANPTRPWGPRTDGAVQACDIDPESNLLYLGGHFDLTNGRHIGKLAAADLDTGALLESWDTDSTRIRGLDAVEVIPGESVAGAGTFNRTGGVDQKSFAAFAIGQPGGPAGGATFPTQTEPVGGPVPPLTKKSGGSRSMNGGCATPAADPCDTSTGNFYENFTDLAVPGRGVPLAFTRSYNSSPAPDAPANGPLGYGWSFNYNMSLSIAADLSSVRVNEENGAAVDFTLNGSAYTAPPRVMATLVRNGDNTWTFTRRNREIYLFNSSGRLTALKDLNGYTTTLSYNGSGQLATVKDPADRTLTFGWAGGRIASVTDTATPPRSVTFSYSPAGDLTDVIDVGGGHSTFGYDANHRMTTKRAPKYYGDTATTPTPVVTNTYDASGRVATQRDPLGRTTTFDYTSIPSATKVTDPKGNVRVDYFQYGLLVKRTLGYGTPAAATWEYRYDPATLARTAILDPNGDVTTMWYDSAGNLLSSTDPLGRPTWATYNPLNQPLTVTDAAYVTSTFTYDPAGNPLSASTPLEGSNPPVSATTTSTYDPARPGDVTQTTDPDGKVWTRAWDSYGNLSSETTPPTPASPNGDTTRYCYDPVGRRTKVISPKGSAAGVTCTTANPTFTTVIVPDAFGAPVSVTDALGQRTVSTYDANGNRTTTTDANGQTTTWTYDAANQLVEEIRPGGGSGIEVGSSTSNNNAAPASTLVLTTPAGVAANTVMVAGVAVRGSVTVTAPAGWTLIRSDANGSSMKLLSYYRIATGSEPTSSTWSFSSAKAAAGTITAYRGVDTTNPVDVANGLANLNDSTSIVAPSVTTTGANERIIGLFAIMRATTITAPAGMDERGEATSSGGTEPPVTIESADTTQPAAQATGDKTATAPVADRNSGQLIALRAAAAPSGTGIQVRSSISGQNAAPASTLVLTTPAGVAANDVMVAAVAVRGVPTVTAPAGWTLIRSDSNGSSMKLLSYSRTATGSEAASYTWSFSTARAAAGTITAYSGVDPTSPVDVHSGLANTIDAAAIVAPSVTTTGPAERIIGLFSTMKATTITEPAGMTERGEATSSAGTEPPVTIESADTTQATAGATGDKTATAAAADRANGQLIALRPAGGGGGGSTGAGTKLRYDYHPDGSLWRYYDGAGRATTYGYDPLGRQTTVTDPLNRTTTNGYDPAGRLISKQDPGGNCAAVPKTACTTLTYDDAGQLTKIDYSDPATPDVTNVYDNLGRRTAMTDGTGTSTWQWDSLGRLTRSVDGAGKTVGYGYDRRSNVTSITYPGSTGTVLRTVDDTGRLWKVKDWLNNETVFNYDPNGFLTSQAYPNGTKATNTPDAAGRLMGISHAPTATPSSPFASFSYGRDNVNQVQSVASAGVPTDNRTYGYTPMNQLSSDNGGTYAYDNADNLTGFPSGANLAHDAANQLVSLTSTAGTTTFGYDSRGNRTTVTPPAGPASTLTYDQANRLKGHNTANATYAYNGEGLRMSKTVAGATTGFTWDVAQGLPLLLVDGTTNYVYGPGGLPLQQITSAGQVTYYHQDQLGSTRALTNSSGTVVATYTYDPYGNLAGSTGTATNPFRYAGQYTDPETGYQYLRARYYDPSTAQFLTRDPIEDVTRSAYAYVNGNPLNATDPTGLISTRYTAFVEGGSSLDCETGVPPFGTIGMGLEGVRNVAVGLDKRASAVGRAMRTSGDAATRSQAARLLPSAGRLSNNPAVEGLAKGAGRAVPWVAGGLEVADHIAQGDSLGRTIAETGGSVAFGAAGAAAGALGCGFVAVGTAGAGAFLCAGAVAVGGGVGSWGGKLLGSAASNIFDW